MLCKRVANIGPILRKPWEATVYVLALSKGMKRLQCGEGRRAPRSFWAFSPRSGSLVLVAATTIGIFLCFRLVQPFLSALVWALALATLFLPFQRRLESILPAKGLAATCSVLVAGLIVVIPAVFVGERLANEALQSAGQISFEDWGKHFEKNPRLVVIAKSIEKHVNLPDAIHAGVAKITGWGGALLKSSVVELFHLALTFYLLFYMLRDHDLVIKAMKSFSPLTARETEELCVEIGHTIHATVYGAGIVAVVQGALGGLMFWWLGLTAPVFWGFVMALLAFLPFFGAFVVWIPATCFLALDGQWEKALILGLWGAVVIGLVDNWLYPILVGQKLKLHTTLAFISTVGGLVVFGPPGLILGPIVLTVTLFLLRIWQDRARAIVGK